MSEVGRVSGDEQGLVAGLLTSNPVRNGEQEPGGAWGWGLCQDVSGMGTCQTGKGRGWCTAFPPMQLC